jgi:hypothetical protein
MVTLPDIPAGFPVTPNGPVGRGLVPRRPAGSKDAEPQGEGSPALDASERSIKARRRAGSYTVLDSLFAMLARSEEYTVTARDQYERFQWAHTTVQPPEAAVRPAVSEYAQLLLKRIKETAARCGLPMIRKEPWPHGKPMAACLTHDVDVVRRGKLPRGVAGKDVRAILGDTVRGRLGTAAGRAATVARTAAGPNPYWTFERIGSIEKSHGFRSTYFVMAGQSHPQDAAYSPAEPKMARLMGDLRDSGCEIALHGSFVSYKDAASLRAQKSRLEAVLRTQVTGHRNHILRFRAPDSWQVHEAAGFSYDATLGFADHEGYRGGHAFPFHPYDAEADRQLEIVEIPLAVMEVTVHKYRGLRGKDAWWAVDQVLEQTLAVNGLATLLWHNDTFYDPDYPGCGQIYETALDWLSDRGSWVAPCAEADRWWRARENVRLSPLPGGETGWMMDASDAIDGLVLRFSSPEQGRTPQAFGQTATVTSDGSDYLLEFGRLPAGSHAEIRF